MTAATVLVGNPRAGSRTLAAARLLSGLLTGEEPARVLDAVTLGPGLLGEGGPAMGEALAEVGRARLLVVASPTYKASYTGVLKAFLDQLPADGLAGVVAVPLMLGAGPSHALAAELHLKPVLVELGATCPTRACYVLEQDHLDPAAYGPFLERARPQLAAALAGGA